MSSFSSDELEKFSEAVRLLKLYRRADMEGADGRDLIDQLYVDPLPNDHVLNQIRHPATTFIIGRKGTGKSTVFLRARKSLLSEKHVVTAYVDIKTVFEASRVAPGLASRVANLRGSLSEEALDQLLLSTTFLRAVVAGIRDDLRDQLKASWKTRALAWFKGDYAELEHKLDDFLEELNEPNFINAEGVRSTQLKTRDQTDVADGFSAELSMGSSGPAAKAAAESRNTSSVEQEIAYSDVLLRTIDAQSLIASLKAMLEPLGFKHLYIFLDDFSELPEFAMRTVVDVLVSPLNNWSEELVKFKIAAYPGRIYYGSLDKSKIDEIPLDLHSVYGPTSVNSMEEKSSDFTQRLLEVRLEHFNLQSGRFFDFDRDSAIWVVLFQACMGNPRTLGYILFFAYESHLLYGKKITAQAIRDAAKRYYESKIEPYFNMGAFLHETFGEKSTIFSLKELLEAIVTRAKELRSKDDSSVFRSIEGRPPTSHFNVDPSFDALLSSLELNFFLTKYFVMSNRDSKRVSVYALNLGLCEKYSIKFGRPENKTREQRLYFVERVFDYNSILQAYVANNQEIECNACGGVFDAADLEFLKRYGMSCPSCKSGTCVVTNTAKKYAELIIQVSGEQLLPATELGILRSLDSEDGPLVAGDIAGELDVSHQLIGRRAKKLDEQRLVSRELVGARREYSLTDLAREAYFSDRAGWSLQVPIDEALD